MTRVPITVTNPELVSEWHPTKNLPFTPEEAIRGSKRKVWWICPQGHDYESALATRCIQGSGCNICSGTRVLAGFNDLGTKEPELAKEFHPTKNAPDTPQTVSPTTAKKLWWICGLGHEYQATAANRSSNGSGCPVCTGKIIVIGFNDLASLRPDLASEWHPTKNSLKPTEVTFGTAKKVWWQCKNDSAHVWEVSVNRRTGNDRLVGCPFCASQKVLPGNNDLATTNPDIAEQWHPTKNGELKPTQFMAGSGKTVWWQCPNVPEHAYQMVINRKAGDRRQGCPICSNKLLVTGINDLATTHPLIAKSWHPTLNGDVQPDSLTYGSSQKVWWQCDLGHSWKATPATRTSLENGCPVCSNQTVLAGFNDLATTHPEFARQWHPTMNGALKPTDVVAGARQKIWWQCDVDPRHHWLVSTQERKRRPGCYICSGKQVQLGVNDLETLNPELASQWHPTRNGDLKPSKVSVGSSSKAIWWVCQNNSEHVWRATVAARHTGNKTGCPTCAKTGFDGAMPGYFYILEHREMAARKVGITNIGVKTDRLSAFQANGWVVLKKYEHNNGYIIIDLETKMLRWIRKDLGLPAYLGKREMKNTGGQSETFAGDGPSNFEVLAKADAIFEEVIDLHLNVDESSNT